MHKLARQVRFSINPFLPEDRPGSNAFASKPAGEGLAIFLELTVGLAGAVDAETGFIVNVLDIDEYVRRFVVPVFADRIRRDFRSGLHIGLSALYELLLAARAGLAEKFGAGLDLGLALNPFRKICIDAGDTDMLYFGEKFEFAASHKLWNEKWTTGRNFEVFGRCANPTGHGHNYIVEVTVKTARPDDFAAGAFEETVQRELIGVLDHHNLNADVPHFAKVNPTVENIAAFGWEKLAGRFANAKLHCVTVWESDKTFCSCYGP